MSTQVKTFIGKTNNIELIPYNYTTNPYRKVLELAFDNDWKQIIFTTFIYKELIKRLYSEEFCLLKINFHDSISEDEFDAVNTLIRQINTSNGNKSLITLLLKEIDWLVNLQSIDIDSIQAMDREERETFEIYSNGVILGNEKVINKVKEKILGKIIKTPNDVIQ